MVDLPNLPTNKIELLKLTTELLLSQEFLDRNVELRQLTLDSSKQQFQKGQGWITLDTLIAVPAFAKVKGDNFYPKKDLAKCIKTSLHIEVDDQYDKIRLRPTDILIHVAKINIEKWTEINLKEQLIKAGKTPKVIEFISQTHSDSLYIQFEYDKSNDLESFTENLCKTVTEIVESEACQKFNCNSICGYSFNTILSAFLESKQVPNIDTLTKQENYTEFTVIKDVIKACRTGLPVAKVLPLHSNRKISKEQKLRSDAQNFVPQSDKNIESDKILTIVNNNHYYVNAVIDNQNQTQHVTSEQQVVQVSYFPGQEYQYLQNYEQVDNNVYYQTSNTGNFSYNPEYFDQQNQPQIYETQPQNINGSLQKQEIIKQAQNSPIQVQPNGRISIVQDENYQPQQIQEMYETYNPYMVNQLYPVQEMEASQVYNGETYYEQPPQIMQPVYEYSQVVPMFPYIPIPSADNPFMPPKKSFAKNYSPRHKHNSDTSEKKFNLEEEAFPTLGSAHESTPVKALGNKPSMASLLSTARVASKTESVIIDLSKTSSDSTPSSRLSTTETEKSKRSSHESNKEEKSVEESTRIDAVEEVSCEFKNVQIKVKSTKPITPKDSGFESSSDYGKERNSNSCIKNSTRLDLSSVNSTEFLPELETKASVPEEDDFKPVESKQERRKSNRIRSSSSMNSDKLVKNKPFKQSRSNESTGSNKSVNRSPQKPEEFIQGYSIPGGRQPLVQGVGGKSNPWNKKITAVLKNK